MRLRASLLCPTAVLIVAASALVALAADAPLRVTLVDEPTARTIKISAMREIEIVPDEVVLSLSVITEDGKSPLPAKAENDKRTRAVLKTVKSHRVEDKYIKIDCLEIRPVYERRDEVLIKYTVSRGIDVTLQDFDLLEPILSDALGAGRTGLAVFYSARPSIGNISLRRADSPWLTPEKRPATWPNSTAWRSAKPLRLKKKSKGTFTRVVLEARWEEWRGIPKQTLAEQESF